jgi:hypothetical protein
MTSPQPQNVNFPSITLTFTQQSTQLIKSEPIWYRFGAFLNEKCRFIIPGDYKIIIPADPLDSSSVERIVVVENQFSFPQNANSVTLNIQDHIGLLTQSGKLCIEPVNLQTYLQGHIPPFPAHFFQNNISLQNF